MQAEVTGAECRGKLGVGKWGEGDGAVGRLVKSHGTVCAYVNTHTDIYVYFFLMAQRWSLLLIDEPLSS